MEPTHLESLYPDTARFEEIKKILTYMKEGNSSQLIGLPGTGKSNLLRSLAYNRAVRTKHFGENQKWMHFVMNDFSEIRRRPLLDATKFLFLNLVDSLLERNLKEEYEQVRTIFDESLRFSDELVLFQGLKRAIDLLAIEKELTIIFLFDRFEEYVPMVTPDFFSNLRVLRNRAKYRFSAVFSLNKSLDEVLEPSLLSDFYEFLAGHIVYLRLHDTDSMNFRIQYLEHTTGKTLDRKEIASVLKITGGHGKLTRLSLEALLEESPKKDADLSVYLLGKRPIQGALRDIWQAFLPSEQQWLLTIVNGVHENDELVEAYLGNIGILKNETIQIPLFLEFLKTKEQEQSSLQNKITYDQASSTIKIGDTVLSDRLTSAEFRLLQFLLQNPERIIDREEVITVVWKESKSTAGVTDQAVDQLIFRLRKKIEEDPNNPNHIQTIKGRGVKFTP